MLLLLLQLLLASSLTNCRVAHYLPPSSIHSLLRSDAVVMGMTLCIMKPFKPGDVVDVAGVRGTVREVRATFTLVDQPDGDICYVPNAKILGATMVNHSAKGTCKQGG